MNLGSYLGCTYWHHIKIYIVKASGFCNGNIVLIWYWAFLPTYHDFVRWKQHLFDILFFTRLCQGIDNCFYAFGNTRNTTKFEPFHIGSQPTQIRQQRGMKVWIDHAIFFFILSKP